MDDAKRPYTVHAGILNSNFQKEIWPDNLDYRLANDGWGMCNTASGIRTSYGNEFVICQFGGIHCNVDHVYIKLRNMDESLLRLTKVIEKLVDMAEWVDAHG